MAKAVKAKVANEKQIELNRWCIEMAMRWPTITMYAQGNGFGTYHPSPPAQQVDADVIGRAAKIRAWVHA